MQVRAAAGGPRPVAAEAAVERLETANGEGTVGVAAAVARLEGALGQAVRAEREGEVLHALHARLRRAEGSKGAE